MFEVGNRVRITSNDSFYGKLGTVVLVTNQGWYDYIVALDDYKNTSQFALDSCAFYGVPDSSIPFEPEDLELV